MKTFKIVLITVLAVVFLAGIGLFLIGYFKPKPGGILVSASTSSSVFVNGDLVGKTPYEGAFKAGIIVLKVVPESSDKNYFPYEAKITLVSGVKTIVRREFAETQDASSGDIISFEKEGRKEAGLVVISVPDGAQISIDGVAKGFAPHKTSSIFQGEHQVTIKSPGYLDRVLTVKTVVGYKLTIFAKLAKLPEEPKVEAAKTEIKIFVEILDTPTGFLRVRSEPGSLGREVGRVKPQEKFLLLEEDAQSGWYRIQNGWVSNAYSKKVEEEVAGFSDSGD